MALTIYRKQSIDHSSISSKRFAIHSMILALMTACASDPPLPTASEQLDGTGYDTRAAYNKPYSVKGKTYYPLLNADGYIERGIASWYGAESGNRTAMGSPFNPNRLTAAHKTLPLPCKVRVTNLKNGR